MKNKRIVSVSKNEKQEVNKKFMVRFVYVTFSTSLFFFYFCFLVDYDCLRVNELVWIKIVQIVMMKFNKYFQNKRSHLIHIKKKEVSSAFETFQFSSSINSLFLLCNYYIECPVINAFSYIISCA